jgi:hypothetical protein
MQFETALMGLAIHILIWDKLPEWGSWFPALIAHLPKPLKHLYDGWQCAYCFGFWISLCLHAFTGIWTLSDLGGIESRAGFGTPVAWILDALSTGTIIYFARHALGTLSWGAAKGYFASEEFKASFAEPPSDTEEGVTS